MLYNQTKINGYLRIIMNNYIDKLKVLRNLKDSRVICRLLEYDACKGESEYNGLLYEIYAAGAECNLLRSVQNEILHDVNAFSSDCAKGVKISPFLKAAYLNDLKYISDAVSELPDGKDFRLGGPLPVFDCPQERLIDVLEDFYRRNGYGTFIDGRVFEYCQGKFIPLSGTADITLSQLKNYGAEKAVIENNVKNFLEGLPFSHMLLYGDRGTGKSSTVHAMLNAYADRGLRLVELGKDELYSIRKIKQQVADLPLKFILFVDDLSLDERDDRTSALKSAIEGTFVCGNNVMLAATSNRRHVVKEKFSDRDNSVHPADSIEEQLSLSDRFGITVMFSSTDKAEYLSIVNQLAADRGLSTPKDKLEALAERWAIVNGGRSPRRAKQFTDFVFACEQSGRPLEF